MRILEILVLLGVTGGVLATPFTPYRRPSFGSSAPSPPAPQGATLKLKRTPEPVDVHPEIARVQAVNRAFKKFAKRLGSTAKRDGYSMLLAKHNDILERGHDPGVGHLKKRKLHGNKGQNGQNGQNGGGTQNNGAAATAAAPGAQFTGVSFSKTPTLSPAVALDEDGDDISYFSTLQLGTPGKNFTLVMDSGSSDLWVPSPNCQSTACQVHQSLGSQDSSTLQTTTTQWSIEYGSGAANGVLVADSVAIGGLKIDRMPFGVVTELSDNFAQQTPDGILGMGFQEANTQQVATLFDELATQKLIPQKLIGVKLQRQADNTDDGEISIGVADTAKFTGSLTLNKNINNRGLWEAAMDDVTINGKSLGLKGRSSILDTGTTLLIIPPADATTVHSAIPGTQTDGQGNFAMPCNTTVDLAFVFQGTSFSISPKDYVGGALDSTGQLCSSNILGETVGTATQFLSGDVFLKNVYTVFDFDNNQVGLGKLGTDGGAGSTSQSGNGTKLVGRQSDSPSAAPSGARVCGNLNVVLFYSLVSMFAGIFLFT